MEDRSDVPQLRLANAFGPLEFEVFFCDGTDRMFRPALFEVLDEVLAYCGEIVLAGRESLRNQGSSRFGMGDLISGQPGQPVLLMGALGQLKIQFLCPNNRLLPRF